MAENGNVVKFPQHKRIECPMCGATNIKTTIETDTFPYGDGVKVVELTVHVPVRTCTSCDYQFTDYIAEEIRHEAVCRHLGVMSPKEIRGIRKAYRMSRAEFALLTRIGVASLSRWERGQLIQNPAYDQLLYLLSFLENLKRLKSRPPEGPSGTSEHDGGEEVGGWAKLRALQPTKQDRAAAAAFELIRTGT